MSGGWYSRPPIDEMMQADWYNAKQQLNPTAYSNLRKVAKASGFAPDKNPFSIELDTESDTRQHMRSLNEKNVAEFNRSVTEWANKVRSETRKNIKSLVKKDKNLSKSIKASYKFTKGELSAIGFSFRREGAWLFYGAGRGYGGDGSRTSWHDRHGNIRTANPNSLYKSGTGNRKAKDWFSPSVRAHIEELADIVANYDAAIVVNTFNILKPQENG